MDAVFLSRIQFALTAGFHFLFPPLTFGVALILVIIESLYFKTRDEIYIKISKFIVKIFTLIFTVGVATGIVLEFSFGTNWSTYSRMVGDIFGAPLAAEGVLAFFLESTFLGILIFGREKVSKKTYYIAAIMVFLASHLSGFWIIIANSWMQTPAGFEIKNGVARLTDVFAAAVNHSTFQRYFHTVIAGWITGSLFLAGISAWYVKKNRDLKYAKPLLVISLSVFIISSILQFGTGHAHAVQVAKTQPEKMASFEALWQTEKGAPMSLFGFPDEANSKTYFEIAVPKLLSIMIDFKTDSEVKGLNEYKKEDKPPLFITYMSYHMMIWLGSAFGLLSAIGAFLIFRKKLFDARWYLTALIFSIPLPLLANEVGWIAAEVGRQPWVVYKILRTADAASKVVPAEQILFTIIMFTIIYIILFIFFIKLLRNLIDQGPEKISSEGY